MITLIIVDPQYDFIEGGKLPVNGGKKALDNIVKLLNSGKVGCVFTTQDWHYGSHESFKDFGGQFPEHCVENTHGAEIYKPIIEAIKNNNIFYSDNDLYKGHYIEEFSAFKSVANEFNNYIEFYVTDAKDIDDESAIFCKDETIVVCGLAGDICVLHTLEALKPFGQLFVYLDGVASLDDGSTLLDYMSENNIKPYNDTKLT